MKFYEFSSNNKVTCLLCGHYCKLKSGQLGICKVNKNINNKIECLVYGYPKAINIDPIEKKPLYHFLPNTKTFSIGTVGCNFKCSFCQNWQLSQEHKIDKQRYFSPKEIVQLALKNNCDSISYTYNEPTIFFPYIFDIAIIAHQNGLKNVMVTNGFESKVVREQMIGVIDAINVDLKSFNDSYYKHKLGGKLDLILENLKFFSKSDIHMEITTLIVPTHNDSEEELNQIASFISNQLKSDTPWHISSFHPDYKEKELPITDVKSLLLAKEIGENHGLTNIHLGNIKGFNVTKRKLAVNGTFYPNEKEELIRYIDHFNEVLENHNLLKKQNTPKAIIVPHAGYIYSGFTANFAYRYIPNNIKNIIVIGPSHKFRFDGASVALYDKYPTPLGDLNINTKLSEHLITKYPFLSFNKEIHCEHSTETQFPFIKRYAPNTNVIELIYGNIDHKDLAKVIEELIIDVNNFFVISTDLSHFYDIKKAKKLDNICLNSIINKDIHIKENGCEACGITGVKSIIEIAKLENLKITLLDYRTSEDVTKDSNSVVGYTSLLI